MRRDVLPPLTLEPFPDIDLRHVLMLTDDTAMLQHATGATPDVRHGYCTDDTARALIAGVLYCDLQPGRRAAGGGPGVPPELVVAMQRYLGFLSYAFDPESGRFRNFMDYDRSWAEQTGSEDSHARALWGLGVAYRRGHIADVQKLAGALFRNALPAAETFQHVRPWAYVLLGLQEYLRSDPDNRHAADVRRRLAEKLLAEWQANAVDGWPWWDDRLTWGNAKLPHALLACGATLGHDEMVETALKTLRWLLEVQTAPDGHLSIIGNHGWYVRGSEPARFDQQPIEAKALVQACLTAAVVTRDAFWVEQAQRCFRWFLGGNDVGAIMYNADTGGCLDGLGPDGPAFNQGAESTLAYLLSVLELHLYDRAQKASEDLFAYTPHPRQVQSPKV